MVQSSYKATFKRRWPGLYKIVWFIHRTIKPMWSWSELLELLDTSRTYYPEAEQKTNREILIDQLRWYLRHGEWLENYYYGLDRKSKSIDEVLRYAAFVRLRDAHNEKGLSYACVMDDKFLFERVAQSLGYPTPSNIALLEPARIEWLSPRHEAPLDSLLNHELDAILKPLHGAGGGRRGDHKGIEGDIGDKWGSVFAG